MCVCTHNTHTHTHTHNTWGVLQVEVAHAYPSPSCANGSCRRTCKFQNSFKRGLFEGKGGSFRAEELTKSQVSKEACFRAQEACLRAKEPCVRALELTKSQVSKEAYFMAACVRFKRGLFQGKRALLQWKF